MYHILIISGIVTDEHDPKVNALLRLMLESTGYFSVKITEEFRGATAETLESYDAILVNYDGRKNVQSDYVGWGINAEWAFYDFIASGKGVIIYHSSMILGNPALPEEFVKLIGGEFNFENGGRKSPKLEMTVNMDTTIHPITKGLSKSWMTAQEDFFVNMTWLPDSKVKVLATVNDDAADYDINSMQKHLASVYQNININELPNINQPHAVAWTNTYGKGRVFVVSIGHGADTIKRPTFVAMLCRAAEWAASGEVTIEPPDLQNEKRLRVFPYYLDMTVTQYGRLTQI